ncbi:XRE family transcriptional regulator [Myroides sp. NP-2]|uniref:XRE family transcriptional regulator n=1 Tax=Myroides sp. NP-2 TaxID=2759945 RepID=UPI0015F92927|nr:XRE family transcriptional regulator [Myroides sp. NP-2]MBB1150423.1 XRE family transcriptional regulator [Myroides sp. NP-2]
MSDKKIIENPAERIKMLADELRVPVSHLGAKLGHNNNATVNSIIYGKTATITNAFADNAIEHIPEINYLFLLKGELPILNNNDTTTQLQQNMLGNNGDITMQQIIAKLDVISKTQIKILKEIEELKKNK